MSNLKNILITGATSGLGLAMAEQYAQTAGVKLFLTGRQPHAPLSSPHSYCQADLSQPAAAEAIAHWLAEQGVTHLHRLIHNAAVGQYGDPGSLPAAQILEMVQVNLKAPVALTHTLLPLLQPAGGKIIFVSSVASVLPTADYALYTATKAAVDGLARNLRIELEGKVTVQLLHPGATNTGLHPKIGIPAEKMNWEKFPPAAQVAHHMVQAIEHNQKLHTTIGLGNQLLRQVALTFPRPLAWAMHRTTAKPAANTPQHVAITGVADGLGRALAHRFAQAGWHITGIDVDVGKAMQTTAELRQYGVEMRFIAADLSRPADVAQVLQVLGEGEPLGLFVHNAGISAAGYFSALPLAHQLKVIDINFTAPLLLTAGLWHKNLLPAGGMLAFVSSLSAYVGYPGATVYASSKDGLTSYAQSIATTGRWHTLTIYPGPLRTAHARRYSPDNGRENSRMLPETAADLIFYAVQHHQQVLIPGFSAKLFAFLGYLAPRLMEKAMKRMILDKFPPS
jgi:short-subunit dehydrogenase